ncbi:PLP-dependent transferase [Epithele typhae]|uniref:PLP-dependent transferase n=1 Tax=Epithele typhae TaxID=378194 RepID=UPI002007D816|nr:PLP-dependent transferase [Epithele typhae]KAH9933640.1 PLP-dependent transferase [Epithele typhae]
MSSSNAPPLDVALNAAISMRKKLAVPTPDLNAPAPSSAPDLFSNDYLSVTTNPKVRERFLARIVKEPRVFGTSGSRLLFGNKSPHVQFEQRMRAFFRWPAALLFNSGYDANLSFLHSVPQPGDAIVFDELMHASTRDGINMSRCRHSQYGFAHNSVASFREVLQKTLVRHPNIAAGKSTVFIAVETLYSMDGDFCPLRQIIETVEELVPKGSAHIMVDEAHTSGLFGDGRGLVPELGLQDRVHSILHTFSKTWGMSGAVFLTTPLVRHYMIGYARPMIYSTSLPYSHLVALNTTWDFVSGPEGQALVPRLRALAAHFESALHAALARAQVPSDLLALRPRAVPADFPAHVFSPVFPVLTRASKALADVLDAGGYALTPIPFPVVPRGEERIRVVVHAGNTEAEIDEFVARICVWAREFAAREEQEKGEPRATGVLARL